MADSPETAQEAAAVAEGQATQPEAQRSKTDKGRAQRGKRAQPASPYDAAMGAPTRQPASIRPVTESPNGWLLAELRSTLEAGKREVRGLRRRLRITYWATIILSVGLFLFGVALIGFPARAFFRGEIDEINFAILGGFGGLVLALLLYFRPLERLQALVADSTYVAMVKDSFQYQVTLRMLALDTDDPESLTTAAGYVAEAAQASMDLVYTQMQARRAAGYSGAAGV